MSESKARSSVSSLSIEHTAQVQVTGQLWEVDNERLALKGSVRLATNNITLNIPYPDLREKSLLYLGIRNGKAS